MLEKSGLISRGRVGQSRPARLAGGPLGAAAKWLLGYKEFWDGGLERLDAYLEALQREPGQ